MKKIFHCYAAILTWKIQIYGHFLQVNTHTEISTNAIILTEVAGEGGTDCPPQKFLFSQQFK